MIYPDNACEKLGLNEIKALIKAYCLSEMGQEMIEKMQVMSRFGQINKFLRQTQEFKHLLQYDTPLPIQHLYPIDILAQKAKLSGAFLSEDEFARLFLSLQTVFAVIHYF